MLAGCDTAAFLSFAGPNEGFASGFSLCGCADKPPVCFLTGEAILLRTGMACTAGLRLGCRLDEGFNSGTVLLICDALCSGFVFFSNDNGLSRFFSKRVGFEIRVFLGDCRISLVFVVVTSGTIFLRLASTLGFVLRCPSLFVTILAPPRAFCVSLILIFGVRLGISSSSLDGTSKTSADLGLLGVGTRDWMIGGFSRLGAEIFSSSLDGTSNTSPVLGLLGVGTRD